MASTAPKQGEFSPSLVESNSVLILGQVHEKSLDISTGSIKNTGKQTSPSLVEPHCVCPRTGRQEEIRYIYK